MAAVFGFGTAGEMPSLYEVDAVYRGIVITSFTDLLVIDVTGLLNVVGDALIELAVFATGETL